MFPTLFGAFSSKRSDVAAGQGGSAERLESGSESTASGALRPEAIELVLEEGLLMALGPDGDPVPPDAFAAMASASPEASVHLASGGEVPIEKAAAVLQAQAGGKIVTGAQADAWIAAMLGLGSRPEMASPGELAAEADSMAPPPSASPRRAPGENGGSKAADADMASIPLGIALPCPDGLDAARVSLVVLSGLPEGCVLSAGIDEGGGRWLLVPADLEGLVLRVPPDRPESMTIGVTTLAITNRNGDLASAHDDLEVACLPDLPTSTAERKPPNARPRSQPIEIEPALLAGQAVDVLVLRGVPDRLWLSAGIHDASIDGWVLRPAEIDGLRVHAADSVAPRFTITVLGIDLRQEAAGQAREIARIPIVFD